MSDGSDVRAPDPGLQELAPGVEYRDLAVGTGEPCPPAARGLVRYTGWLPDGTVFDSTRDRGGVATEFDLATVIPGWQDGVPGMRVGGVRKLVIAPGQGYGAKGHGKVPPNSRLIFEVELLSFTPATPTAPPGLAKLSDGTDPGADDPALKDIGEGLKVRDLKVGTGAEAKPGDTVVAHYTGWLMNGAVFDSSVPRGPPPELALGKMLPGWQKGIPGMKVGGVRKLVIPPALAYGPNRVGIVPPNSTLVVEVGLVGVK
jgi:peptidylprolyl isomerase